MMYLKFLNIVICIFFFGVILGIIIIIIMINNLEEVFSDLLFC